MNLKLLAIRRSKVWVLDRKVRGLPPRSAGIVLKKFDRKVRDRKVRGLCVHRSDLQRGKIRYWTPKTISISDFQSTFYGVQKGIVQTLFIDCYVLYFVGPFIKNIKFES